MTGSSDANREHEALGAVTLWVGWWICAVYASDRFHHAWWRDPKNVSTMVRNALASPKLANGGVPWSVALREHPSTISEMMGESDSAQGAVAKSICLPALLLITIGGFMVHSAGPSISCALLHFGLAALPGVGLMMVVYTPVLTLVPKFGWTRTPSESEDCWLVQWFMVHMIGFFLVFGSALCLQVPLSIYQLCYWNSSTLDWCILARYTNLMLTTLSILSILCAIPSMFFMLTADKSQHKDVAGYKSFNGELTALKGIAFGYMFASCARLLTPAASVSYADVALQVCLVIYTLVSFCKEVCQMLQSLVFWERLDWDDIAEESLAARTGPLSRGMQKLTGQPLCFLRIAQAGQPFKDDELTVGAKHPKIKQFLIRVYACVTVEAIDFHQLSREDLRNFNSDLALVLNQFVAPETVYFPYGKKFKFERKLPFLRVSCKDHAAEVARIERTMKANDQPLKYGEDDEIDAYNITEMVLDDPRASFLKTTPLVKAMVERDCCEMYELFGNLLGDTTMPFVSPVTRPGFKPPGGLSYEIQVRGVTAAPPVVILHVVAGHEMPADWNPKRSQIPHERKRTLDDITEDRSEAKKAK